MDISTLTKNPSCDQNVYEKKLIRIKEEIGEINKENKKDLEIKVEKANKIISSEGTHLKFEIHQKTHDVMVKIIDSDTGKVLRELPPEKLIDMIAKICEMAGLFVDKRI
ncbi:MAG: flagellar protein FlaG [Clostridium sp.]